MITTVGVLLVSPEVNNHPTTQRTAPTTKNGGGGVPHVSSAAIENLWSEGLGS